MEVEEIAKYEEIAWRQSRELMVDARDRIPSSFTGWPMLIKNTITLGDWKSMESWRTKQRRSRRTFWSSTKAYIQRIYKKDGWFYEVNASYMGNKQKAILICFCTAKLLHNCGSFSWILLVRIWSSFEMVKVLLEGIMAQKGTGLEKEQKILYYDKYATTYFLITILRNPYTDPYFQYVSSYTRKKVSKHLFLILEIWLFVLQNKLYSSPAMASKGCPEG